MPSSIELVQDTKLNLNKIDKVVEVEIEDNENEVVLGFLEPQDDSLSSPTIDDLPSLYGGSPFWLTPINEKNQIDLESHLSCNLCNKPMSFLLQFYAPESFPIDAFHRYIYIFICSNSKCYGLSDGSISSPNLNNKNNIPIKILRSQLADINEYYPKYDQDNNLINHIINRTINHWPLIKSIDNITNHSLPIILPEYDIVTEYEDKEKLLKALAVSKNAEEEEDDDDDEDDEEEEEIEINNANNNITQVKLKDIDTYMKTHEGKLDINENIKNKQDNQNSKDKNNEESNLINTSTIEELNLVNTSTAEESNLIKESLKNETDYKDSDINVDKEFIHFQQHMSIEPDQILRYNRSPINGIETKPLYCNINGIPNNKDIPNCEYCGNKRSFEFQITPQILSHLGSNIDSTAKESVDFGTIFIYTCNNNCSSSNDNYMLEFAWIQNFSSNSLSDNWN